MLPWRLASPVVALVAALAACAAQARRWRRNRSSTDRPVTEKTLLDRIQIQDFLTRYYYDLSVGKAHELAEYFTEDAVLDVDGVVAKGHKEIAKLYARPEGQASPAKKHYRRGNMLLTNPIINIEGDVATAHLLWTGVMNEGVGKAPSLYEQGREYTRAEEGQGQVAHQRSASSAPIADCPTSSTRPGSRASIAERGVARPGASGPELRP